MNGPIATAAAVKSHQAQQLAWQHAQQAGAAPETALQDGLDTTGPRGGGSPSVAVQDQTHGAGLAAVDRGMTDAEKFGSH